MIRQPDGQRDDGRIRVGVAASREHQLSKTIRLGVSDSLPSQEGVKFLHTQVEVMQNLPEQAGLEVAGMNG